LRAESPVAKLLRESWDL